MSPAHPLVLLGLPKGCGKCGKDVLQILAGLNTSAGLLWDLWGVISVPQLLSSPGEINYIHIQFSKHCQGRDLLSAASFMNDDIYTKYQREAQMEGWGPSLWRAGIPYARRWLMLSVCYKG